MNIYTYEEVLAALREIVRKKGEETTADCIYAERDEYGSVTPVCIVGHFLWEHALIEDDEWNQIEDQNADYALDFLEGEKRAHFTGDARKLLLTVQQSQDSRAPWGVALDAGVLSVEEKS